MAALVAAVAVLAYLPSLGGPFHFDDYNVIVDYPTVHSWSTLFERAGGGVRAVLKASYVLNWTLDPGPLGFHLVNIALHAANTVLLFLIGRRLVPDNVRNYFVSPALLAALLFALHPMQTEAVTYISGRSSSLMAAFYLSALLLYLRGAHWALSGLLFVLAVATRETAVTLPAALLLIELCRGTAWRTIVQRQAAHWLLLVAGVAVVLTNPRYFELLAYGYGERSLGGNLLTQIGGVSYLIWHLVGLHDLNIDPALPSITEWSAALAFQFVLLLALFALGVANLRRRPWLAFGILWFFLQLAPTNSIVPRLDVANDRQLYLACWGLFFALAVQIDWPRAVAVALCLLFAGASVIRQLDYRDEITLWEASVRSSPWNARAHNNLGYAYYQAGRKPEAKREFQTALLLDRTEKKARANLVLLDWR
jgi:tetratricopeptide (TPR) repeat protein